MLKHFSIPSLIKEGSVCCFLLSKSGSSVATLVFNCCPNGHSKASRPGWRSWMRSGRQLVTTCLWRWHPWGQGSWLWAARLSSADGSSCGLVADQWLVGRTDLGWPWACGTVCWRCHRRTWLPEDHWGRPSCLFHPSHWLDWLEECCHEHQPEN